MKRDWCEGNTLGNYLYYDTNTGRILGEVSKVGMVGDRTSASAYPDPREPMYVLGQYINYKYAKRSVEDYWIMQDNIIEGNVLGYE